MKSLLAFVRRFLPWLVLLAALAAVAPALLPPRNPGPFDLQGFARLPVLAGGRMKPLDTVARTSLLQIQHRQTVYLEDAQGLPSAKPVEVSPDEWLLDVFFRPEKAENYRIFVVDNPDVLNLIGQSQESVKIHYPDLKRQILGGFDFMPTSWRRFSYRQIKPYFAQIEEQGKLGAQVEAQARTAFQRDVLQLASDLQIFQKLEHAVQPPEAKDFLGELLRFQKALPEGVAAVRAKEANKPHDEDLAQSMLKMGERYLAMSDATDLLVVPAPENRPDMSGWRTAGQGVLTAFQTGQVDPAVLVYAGLGAAWRAQNAEQFNHILELYLPPLERQFGPQMRKVKAEVRFNAAQLFYQGMPVFLLAFFLAVASWMFWPQACRKSALGLLGLGFVLTVAGIALRVWLQGHPPVTNLYSSAPYIGFVAVLLCLILELIFKNGIGAAAGGIIGFGTLFIAHHLALSGDTMEMMQAVLDNNFWLATHVLVITTGYGATFLAGFLALIYIVRGVFTRSLDRETANALGRMVYGIVCAATLFSFVGTVLGGIWADQSWGRFWGWDPKENGALIIVVWNALILHARWGGMVRQRGLMCLAVFGNIVTSWSWFGVNMLGIGLHSYGFTTATFWSLIWFVTSQLALIAIGLMPLSRWRSFQGAPRHEPGRSSPSGRPTSEPAR